MQHHRARFTALGRKAVVDRVIEHGETTVWEWVRRWRQASPQDRASLESLRERSSRPHRSPNQISPDDAERICELRQRTGWSPRRLADELHRPHSTIHRVLQRAGYSRQPLAERPAVIRYEWPCPGNLLHMDTKKLGKFEVPGHALTGDRTQRSRRVGWEYVHSVISVIDDHSRLAYSEIHDDEKAETVTGFFDRALNFFTEHGICVERLMTDNAWAYVHNRSLAARLDLYAIKHIRTRPYTPRTNGKVERFQQTLAREWAYAMEYANSDARRESLPHWITYYNERRTHSALGNRPPIVRVRNVTGLNS